MNNKSVADIVGPWVDADWESDLIKRCREVWYIPIGNLSNEMLATFLRQEIATDIVLEEASVRLRTGFNDNSEMYEGELAAAARYAIERQTGPTGG